MSRFCLLVACCTVLTACASIVSGGLQSVPIGSTPDGADIQITELSTGLPIATGKTPYTATLKRDSGYFQKAAYKIRVSKEGYLDAERTIEASVNEWYFGNILFGGLIGLIIVDPITGAMWSIPDKPINVSLSREPLATKPMSVEPPFIGGAQPAPVKRKRFQEIIEVP